MNVNPRKTTTLAPDQHEEPARERDDAREDRDERESRIGAAQLAAPSTRRWRRAGTFSSTS